MRQVAQLQEPSFQAVLLAASAFTSAASFEFGQLASAFTLASASSGRNLQAFLPSFITAASFASFVAIVASSSFALESFLPSPCFASEHLPFHLVVAEVEGIGL